MQVTAFIWLVAGGVLGVVGGWFAALESALAAVSRERMEGWRLGGARRGVAGDFAHPRDALLTALFVLGGAARSLAWFAMLMAAVGLQGLSGLPAVLWGVVLLLAVLVGLDVVPRALAAHRPALWEPALRRFAGPVLSRFGPVFDRVHPALAWVAGRLFPWSVTPRTPLGPGEAGLLVQMREEEGALSVPEAEVLTEVLKLSHATVKHYMTPRVDIASVPYSLGAAELHAWLQKRPFHRMPVVGETPDEVLGILDTRRLHTLPPGMHFTEVLLPPSFVPQTMEASQLLQNFLRHRQPMAVVLDEFGGVKGLVTLSDFLEEILADAAPRLESDLYIERLGDGRLLASGGARLDDLSEYVGFDPTREGVETIGGYVVHRLGQFPRAGSTVMLDDWKVTVRRVHQRRVREVSLEKVPREGRA